MTRLLFRALEIMKTSQFLKMEFQRKKVPLSIPSTSTAKSTPLQALKSMNTRISSRKTLTKKKEYLLENKLKMNY